MSHSSELMKHLARHGVPVPDPAANPRGDLLYMVNGKPATVVNRLRGKSELAPSVQHCAQVGAMLARMHLAGRDFTMASGTYKAYLPGGKLSGEGRYTYNAADQKVTWQSGPYVDVWGGAFTVEREGKTHKIRLKSTTIATNSTDSP